MANVIVKKAKDNSKNRRYKQRGELIAKRREEAKALEEQEREAWKEEKGVQGCSDNVTKALTLNTNWREPPKEQEIKDDAMNHKVNHAHQRRPDKKWS
ncbi:hypothetical protein [Enterobacter sp.]|uniref:hypothetical protein n=1 Tax=Enterobacter sp. TaxID=42895 RepID=UPI00296F4805|nr:hypothetical protein [Enterobacter sp.]